MAKSEVLHTTLSSKGQVVLPKAVRDRCGWAPGAKIEVHETPQGVLLTTTPPRVRRVTTIDEVIGSAGYNGPAYTIREMDEAVLAEAARSFDASVRDRD